MVSFAISLYEWQFFFNIVVSVISRLNIFVATVCVNQHFSGMAWLPSNDYTICPEMKKTPESVFFKSIMLIPYDFKVEKSKFVSRNFVVNFPERKVGLSISAIWNGIVVFTPSITNS